MIAGTSIGAGMLALPIISAQQGFPYAVIVLIALWALTLYGALLILEISLHFPHGASFNTLGRQTLGRAGQSFINLCMVSLFYCLTSAYISGASHFLSEGLAQYTNIQWSHSLSALVFTVIFGGLVTWHTFAVDITNRLLLTLKLVAFFIVVALLIPHVDHHLLGNKNHEGKFGFAIAAIPVFFTAFGFHGSVPSIIKYVGHQTKSLRRVFILGSTIPLVLYLLWEIVTLGILPLHGTLSFSHIAAQDGNVAHFINALDSIVNNRWIHGSMHFFTDVAITTSFLGVTLGLFDFFADVLNAQQRSRRLLCAIITFLPPLLFAILSPNAFIAALGYAAIPLAFLAIILPAVMVWRIRHSENHSQYRVIGGPFGLGIAFLLGAMIIAIQLY